MYYLHALYKSASNIPWLFTQRKHISKGLGYVALLSVILAAAYSAYITWKIPVLVEDAIMYIQDEVPDITAMVEDGELQITGVEQPYEYELDDGADQIVFYIDTVSEEPARFEDVIDVRSTDALYVTRQKVIVHNADGATKTEYFDGMESFAISKSDVVRWGEHLAQGVPLFIFAILWFVFFIGFAVWKMLYLVVIAFLVWMILASAKRKILFEEVYTIGLFALTAPSVLTFILWAFFAIQIPYAYTVLTMAILLWAIVAGSSSHAPREMQKK